MTRPLHINRLMAPDSAELVTETLAAVATYVLRSGDRVLVPHFGVVCRRTRRASRVAGRSYGPRVRLALASLKATRRAQ